MINDLVLLITLSIDCVRRMTLFNCTQQPLPQENYTTHLTWGGDSSIDTNVSSYIVQHNLVLTILMDTYALHIFQSTMPVMK